MVNIIHVSQSILIFIILLNILNEAQLINRLRKIKAKSFSDGTAVECLT